MKIHFPPLSIVCPVVFLSCCGSISLVAEPLRLESFADAEAKHKVKLVLPNFPKSVEEITQAVDETIAEFVRVGDEVAALSAESATFENTVKRFDELNNSSRHKLSPVGIVENTSMDAKLREQATKDSQRFEDFAVSFGYREDIYRAVKDAADKAPRLEKAAQRLLAETMRDYKRKGFHLEPDARADAEAMHKEISRLGSDFEQNIRETETTVTFSAEELAGVTEDFLKSVADPEKPGEFTLSGKIAAHFVPVLTLCENEDTRRRMLETRCRHAMDVNISILTEVVKLRAKLAGRLGYGSWADYRTEERMAKNEATVRAFLDDLSRGLQPKLDAELEELRRLKREETGKPDAELFNWDLSYFQNKLLKEEYSIDLEALRIYFPYENCLNGMFSVYEEIFGIKIQQIENTDPWAKGVTLHIVTDAATGKPLGLFYLDMFPRLGKYNHFAQFGIIPCKMLADGIQQRPTVALICNFPKPVGDKPSLLSFDNVETLFHEFGHCMHSILTETEFAGHSGTSVPRDFVEAPSQLLEYWIRDKQVLDRFAADYRDPAKKIPQEILENMKAADLAVIAQHYRGQICFAMTDLLLHSYAHPIQVQDVAAVGNQCFEEYLIARPAGTAYVAGFGHLMGYDAGYYGYAWSDVIAADMASVFEKAPNKFLNKELGARLRKEIYAQGDGRDVNESIEAFLGRPRSMAAFLKNLGISE